MVGGRGIRDGVTIFGSNANSNQLEDSVNANPGMNT